MRLNPAPLTELPPVTRWLAVLFFAGWLAEMMLRFRLNFYLGLVPFNLVSQHWLWQAFTYIFIHANFWHLLFNGFMLWMLGRLLEPAMGARRFLLYFLGCGAAAAVLTAAWQPSSLTPVIGASGAIYGLLGAFAFLFPDTRVYLYFLFPMSARTLAIALGVMEFAFTLAGGRSGISNITHLGGLAAGLAWLWAERRWRERPVPEEPDPAALEQEEIDRLLEKISRLGQGALSRRELERLDAYAKRKGGRA
jgi:membrane associated rhomboid family serine protease